MATFWVWVYHALRTWSNISKWHDGFSIKSSKLFILPLRSHAIVIFVVKDDPKFVKKSIKDVKNNVDSIRIDFFNSIDDWNYEKQIM